MKLGFISTINNIQSMVILLLVISIMVFVLSLIILVVLLMKKSSNTTNNNEEIPKMSEIGIVKAESTLNTAAKNNPYFAKSKHGRRKIFLSKV